jgi:hypothetical protein
MSHETKEAHAAASGTGGTRVLILYYSLTGNTKSIAEKITKENRGRCTNRVESWKLIYFAGNIII